MLDLIRVGLGYDIKADISYLADAESNGLIQTLPVSEYETQRTKLKGLEETLQQNSQKLQQSKTALETTDRKLNSIFYRFFPFTIFTEDKKVQIELERPSIERRYKNDLTEIERLKHSVSELRDQTENYFSLEGICLRATEKGMRLLPETIANEVDNNWSHESHALYMLAVGLAEGNRDKFLEATQMAQKLDNNWSHESHALYTIAAILCNNNGLILSKCAELAKTTDNNWSHESHATYTIAAALTKGQKTIYEKAVDIAIELDNNWSHESHALYTVASIFCGNDPERVKKAKIQADTEDQNWSHESHATYMIAAGIAGVPNEIFKRGSEIANEQDQNWSHETHAIFLSAYAASGYDESRYMRAIKLASALDRNWSHKSHAMYAVASLFCEDKTLLDKVSPR